MTEERAPYGTDELIDLLRFRPPHDPVFAYLYERLSIGELQLFQGEIPVHLIDPFSSEFRPWDYPKGKGAFKFMLDRVEAGTRNAMWVYPKGVRFVVSDDYFTFEAARQLGLDRYPCFIMGRPKASAVHGLKGPLVVSPPTQPKTERNEARFEF